MISTRKCFAMNTRWLVISAFLLIMTTASAIEGVSDAGENKRDSNIPLNGKQVSKNRTADPMNQDYCVDTELE